jgi:hypothetical protein
MHPVGESRGPGGGVLNSDPRLTYPGGPQQGEQPSVVALDELSYLDEAR